MRHPRIKEGIVALNVEVLHPSFARYVPIGSRRPRTEVVALTSRATLTEADPGTFRHLAVLDGRTAVEEHDGQIWMRLWRWDLDRGRPADVTPGEFRDFLVARHHEGMRIPMPDAFQGTPLLAATGTHGTRGTPADGLGELRQGDLGESTSGARVQAFLDQRVRVAGDRVYLRPDMLAAANWQVGRYELSLNALGKRHNVFLGHPARPGPLLAHLGTVVGDKAMAEMERSVRAFETSHEGIPFELVPAYGHVMPALSLFGRQLRHAAADLITVRAISAGNRKALKAILAENEDLWFDVDTNQVEPDALGRLAAIHEAFLANTPDVMESNRLTLARSAAYVQDILAPLMRPDPDAGDLDALAALDPKL